MDSGLDASHRPGMTRERGNDMLNPSANERPATLLVSPLRNLENEIRRFARQFAREQSLALDAADLGHRALRAPVVLADPEHDRVDEGEGMIEHQPLHFAIGAAAPVAADDEGPADLDLAAFGFKAVVAARTDQPAGRSVDEHKTHFRIDRAVEEFPEPGLGVAIADRRNL